MAALIIGGAAIVDRAIRSLGDDADIVNRVGRQRMLSQRIAKASLILTTTQSPTERLAARAELDSAAAQLRRNRLLLLEGDSTRRGAGELHGQARTIVAANQQNFETIFSAATVLVDSGSTRDTRDAARAAILQAEPQFLARTDSAVTALASAARARVDATQIQMYTIVGLVIFGLVAVGWLILRPAVLAIRSAVEQLRQANAELGVARARAEEASRLKSDFLATMSHELRTPLNAVIGLSGLLGETKLDDRQRVFASTINHSGEALLGLINNVLDLSKIDAGKLEFEMLDFDLRDLVETSAETLALRAEGHGIELATYIAPTVPESVRGDQGRIRQVLMNLLANAVKFTERGAVVLRVKDAVEGRLRFEVSDTGPGIPADKINRLFQPFSQVDASTTRRFGGTGLGLDISRRLVELMRGTIGVDSTEGVGSTFWFELPLGTGSAPARHDDVHAVAGKRLLIVDDTAANRIVLADIVRGWGVNGTGVGTPAEAFAMLRDAARRGAPFDGALIDWQMPGMDGHVLAAAIRGDALVRSTPLVLLSSFTDQVGDAAVRSAGFSTAVPKPVRARPLLVALRTVFSTAAAVSIAAAPGSAVPERRTPRWPGRRILVADDNPVNILVLKAILEQYGVRVDVAADGTEVLDALARTSYDLILMDVYMPRLDGPGATRAIREAERTQNTRRKTVVAVTASVTQDDRGECVNAGMDDYVTKPISRESLDATLVRWLGPPATA